MASNGHSLSEIEEALDRNREQMGQTLDALQHRLSTDYIVERARNTLHSSGADEFFCNFQRSVRRNPVALTAFGVGLTWLMISSSDTARRSIDRYTPTPRRKRESSGVDDMASKAEAHAESARGVRDEVAHTAGRGRQAADRMSRRARAGASRVYDTTQQGASRLVERADNMRREQPLVTAAVGLALGAALAAGLPRSRSEDRTLGSARDEFVAKTRAKGSEKTGQVQSVAEVAAEEAKDAAKSEADRQDLRDERN
ncbi:DUF3618 domain-containing protein [Salinisphaera sp.]|uniref:DUF3618 domain-containing protein n=1 Tax=Salinisphaera sp. TaxID=1914330 RepID=UPI002D76D6A1|nr:DUF3618 domain-containing protein [Salinisphaera sp.]HET7313667.1 DUF3618 domain-containing protein [Salinisphaera sp.]